MTESDSVGISDNLKLSLFVFVVMFFIASSSLRETLADNAKKMECVHSYI